CWRMPDGGPGSGSCGSCSCGVSSPSSSGGGDASGAVRGRRAEGGSAGATPGAGSAEARIGNACASWRAGGRNRNPTLRVAFTLEVMIGRALFSFPNPVNELSARLVAGGVLAMALAAIVFGQLWLLAPLAYGFVARVLAGPTLSPLGQFVTR